jgi:hypothetical protein
MKHVDTRIIAAVGLIGNRVCKSKHTMKTTKELKASLAVQAEAFCPWLYPAGRREGQYYLVGSLAGEPGKSLKINVTGPKTGVW